MTGRTIQMADFLAKLQKLNPDVKADFTGSNIYLGGREEEYQRTGLYYKDKHICNIDKGAIPEFNRIGGAQKNWVDVDPAYALANKDTCLTQHILIGPDEFIQLSELNEKLGVRTQAEIYFGGVKVIATREKIITYAGKVEDAILVRRYLKQVELPCHVSRIGWRYICERLINEKIPGITRQSLSKAFGTTLKKGCVDTKSFEDHRREASRL